MSQVHRRRPHREGPSPEELKLARRASRRQGLFAPDLLQGGAQAVVRHAAAGHPVEEPGDVRGRGRHRAERSSSPIAAAARLPSTPARLTYLMALDVWLFLTVLFANFATALAEARGKAQADALRKTRQETPAFRLLRRRHDRGDRLHGPAGRRPRRRRGGPDHPRRRRDHRRRRLGRRVGHHRRIGPGDPRGRRRPLRRHRRHARPLRPHRRARSPPAPASRSSTA